MRYIFRKMVLCLFLVVLQCATYAQDKTLFQKEWFIQNGDTLPYRILLPKDYDPAQKYPVVFFLHGRGESGFDNEKNLANGASLFLRDSIRSAYPAIVVFPQCAPNSYWSNVHTVAAGKSTGSRTFHFIEDGPPSRSMSLLVGLVDNILVRFGVNREQVYAGGLSMGGMGTFELVRRKPGTFAAAFAICGGAHPGTARSIRKTDWWIFHGMKDDVVLPRYSQEMEAALKKQRARVRATYYPNANHNSWDSAFAEPGLLQWLFSVKK